MGPPVSRAQRTIKATDGVALGDYVYMDHGSDYADYADAQVRELITRYKPDILWNDISWPTGEKRLFAMFADYYNTVPDGIVNDRWQTGSLFKKAMGVKPARATFDLLMKQVIKSRPDFLDSIKPPIIPHSDLTTPEYTQYDVTQAKKWETTRGIGNSYGYNRDETDADYASFGEKLFPDFIDAVAKNGNLLLNAGPSGGQGTIPPEQLSRLNGFGSWLRTNGGAVYGSRSYDDPQGETTDGLQVRTTRKDDSLAVVVVGNPQGRRLTVKGLELAGTRGTLLADGSPVTLTRGEDGDTVLEFARDLAGIYSPVIAVPLSGP